MLDTPENTPDTAMVITDKAFYAALGQLRVAAALPTTHAARYARCRDQQYPHASGMTSANHDQESTP